MNPQDLRTFNISISGLDFTTGEAEDGGPVFIKLFPISEIQAELAKSRPWTIPYVPTSLAVDPDNIKPWHARDMWGYFETLLCRNKDESGPVLLNKASSRMREGGKKDDLSRFVHDEVWFSSDIILERRDGSVPHRICYHVDDAPLQDHILSTGELYAIMSTIARRIMSKRCRLHRITPVTLVSASGTRLRVTQGYLNGTSLRLIVRMTRIHDFAAGEEKNWVEVLTVLSLLLAAPIGITV